MLIGAHISAAGDLAQAPVRSRAAGGECFQFFSRPPQGGKPKPITSRLAKEFKDNCRRYRQGAAYIHAPYYINLASANNRIFYGSVSVLRDELARGQVLGVDYVLTHLGSAKDLGEKKGLAKTIKGLAEILKSFHGSTGFLVEISAGSGAIIGDRFEEIAQVIKAPVLKEYSIGVCFDTAHAFASGYDLRTPAAVKKTFRDFDRQLGLKNLKLIHVNDSRAALGSRRDRHAHLGEGEIGLVGLGAVVALAKKKKINLIIETPKDGRDILDIKTLKKLRDQK